MIFHTAKEAKNKLRNLLLLNEFVKKMNIVDALGTSVDWIKYLEDFIKMIRNENPVDLLFKCILHLADGVISFQDFFSLLIASSNLPINKKIYLFEIYGCFPSQDILIKINKPVTENFADIIDKLIKDAELKLAPEFSTEELLEIEKPRYVSPLILNLLIRKLIDNALKEIEGNKENNSIKKLIKLALALPLGQLEMEADIQSLIARFLLSLVRKIPKVSVSCISLILSALRILKENEIVLSLSIQRFLEIYGASIYLYLMKEMFPKKLWPYVLALQSTFSSDKGSFSKKLISYSLKNNDVLRAINEALFAYSERFRDLTIYKDDSFMKFHEIAAGLPWELTNIPLENLTQIIMNSENYFRDIKSEIPRYLLIINEILSLYSELKKLDNQNEHSSISKIMKKYILLSEIQTKMDLFSKELKFQFHANIPPNLKTIHKHVSLSLGSLSRSWAEKVIENYEDIINGKLVDLMPVSVIPSILKQYYLSREPILLVIIDGLRIDDYYAKLRPMILKLGLSIILEKPLVSLLPSITPISRRSIFGGQDSVKCLAHKPNVRGCNVCRESEILKNNLSPRSIYVHGAIGRILNTLGNITRNYGNKIDVLAIVLSELEKASHGAVESFLSRISSDYAIEIVRLIETATEKLKTITKSEPVIALASDHGLETFIKSVNPPINDVIEKLSKSGYLDQTFDLELRERYLILPLHSNRDIEKVKSLFEEFYEDHLIGVSASRLGFKRVILRVKGTPQYTIFPADRALILFPKGYRKFTCTSKKCGVVYHGGISPGEMIVPFAIFG